MPEQDMGQLFVIIGALKRRTSHSRQTPRGFCPSETAASAPDITNRDGSHQNLFFESYLISTFCNFTGPGFKKGYFSLFAIICKPSICNGSGSIPFQPLKYSGLSFWQFLRRTGCNKNAGQILLSPVLFT